MGGGRGNITPEDNTNGFQKNPQNINRKGRKPSLKKQLEKVALSDGWLTFDKKDVQILDNSIKVKVPKEEAMALKMFQIAMGKNPNAAMNAIKLYLETFDGKANQNIRIEDKRPSKEDILAEIKEIDKLLKEKDGK